MKKYISISLILFLAVFIISCEKETTNNVSSITNYATFEYNDFSVIEIGSPFTPKAKAFENGKELTVQINSDLDVNTVGVYTITYSTKNSDGFSSSVIETVVVHDPSIIGTDVSGCFYDIEKTERTGCINLVEGTTSIFYSTDFGFRAAFPMYFQMNGDIISEIYQTYTLDATSVDLTYDPVLKQFTTFIKPDQFSYTFQLN